MSESYNHEEFVAEMNELKKAILSQVLPELPSNPESKAVGDALNIEAEKVNQELIDSIDELIKAGEDYHKGQQGSD